MQVEKIIKHFGSQVAVAQALGVAQPTISMWKARGRVPPLQQLRLQELTDGQLRAENSILRRKISRS